MMMNCETLTQNLDAYLDKQLTKQAFSEIEEHLSSCAACRNKISQAERLSLELRHLPAPAMRPGFAAQAIAKATGVAPHDHHRRGFIAGFSTALAASIALVAVLVLMPGSLNPLQPAVELPDPTQLSIAQVAITVDQTQTVNLVFDSGTALHNATLSITLPEHVEIDGLPGQQQLSWRTDLHQGKNILPIPLLARSNTSGEIVASIEQGGKTKTIRIQLTAQAKPLPQAMLKSTLSV